jgi:hypothetical protein
MYPRGDLDFDLTVDGDVRHWGASRATVASRVTVRCVQLWVGSILGLLCVGGSARDVDKI